MNIQQAGFGDAAFDRCIEIRLEVFVGEQNVPLEEERDEYDATALHFLATEGDAALATARVILKNNGATAKIGRVAVLKPARGRGIGAALIRHIENDVPATEYLLDAQSHALAFYERLGYVAYGDEFMDAGIPHFHMRKTASV